MKSARTITMRMRFLKSRSFVRRRLRFLWSFVIARRMPAIARIRPNIPASVRAKRRMLCTG